jgi:hypothetical protein
MSSLAMTIGEKTKNVKNVSYSHMVTYLLDDRYERVKTSDRIGNL